MRPGPKKPGESAAEYSARVKAMEQKWMSGIGGTKGGTKAAGAGVRASKPTGTTPVGPRTQSASTPTRVSAGGVGGRRDMAPIDSGRKLIPTPPKHSPKGGAGTGGGRGTAAAPGYGGGKPKVSKTPIRPGRLSGFGNMKSGGMVKGKK